MFALSSVAFFSHESPFFQFIKSAPGLRHLCNDFWFLLTKEQFQYSECDANKALLEDEALLFSDDQEHSNDSTDESISDEMDIYSGVDCIKHRNRNFPSDDDDDDLDTEFFCDHY